MLSVTRMVSFRLLIGVFSAGLLLMLALCLLPFGLPLWFPVSGLALFAGLIADLLLIREEDQNYFE